MGMWGSGLYSNDLAEDLKPLVRALMRLPLSTERLVELATADLRQIANDSSNEDHTTFWFVLADQLHRAGISAPDVFKRAQTLIQLGADAEMMRQLGMNPSDLLKRSRKLTELARRLDEAPPSKRIKHLTRPEPLVMQVGELLAAPLSAQSRARNPYLAKEDFTPATWLPFVVIAAGHALGYLGVYCVAVLRDHSPTAHLPALEELMSKGSWYVELPGTCTPTHFKRMQLQTIGRVLVGDSRVSALAGQAIALMQHCAVHDISIANRLSFEGANSESFESFDDLIG